VGAVIARVGGPDAHLLALALHPSWRQQGIGSSLLRALDQEIIHKGASRLIALVHPGQVGELAFANQGFTHLDGLHLYVRDASMVPRNWRPSSATAVASRVGALGVDEGLLLDEGALGAPGGRTPRPP